MAKSAATPLRALGYEMYAVGGTLQAHASGGANDPTTLRGTKAISAVHAGSNGKYTLTLLGGYKTLQSLSLLLGADTDTAVDGWTVQYDDGTIAQTSTAITVAFTVFDGTTATDLPADTHVSVMALASDSSLT